MTRKSEFSSCSCKRNVSFNRRSSNGLGTICGKPLSRSSRKLSACKRKLASAVLESVHMGEPGPGEVLLRMEACGLCHSDVFVATIEKLPLAPVTLGHEGIGRVEKVGDGVTGDGVASAGGSGGVALG